MTNRFCLLIIMLIVLAMAFLQGIAEAGTDGDAGSQQTSDAEICSALRDHWDDLQELTKAIGNVYDQHPSTRFINVYRRIVELDPSNDYARVYLSNAYAAVGRKEEALAQAREVVHRWPRRAASVADVFGQYRLYDEALIHLRRASDSQSAGGLYYDMAVARIYWSMGRRRDASELVKKLETQYASTAPTYSWLSSLLYYYWNTRDVTNLASTIPDVERFFGTERLEDAVMCAGGGSIAKKMVLADALAVALKSRPDCPQSRLFLADLYGSTGQVGKLEALTRNMIATRPPDRKTLNRLLYLTYGMGSAGNELRLEILQIEYRYWPGSKWVVDSLATEYVRRGEPKAAYTHARMLERKWPKEHDALYWAACHYDRTGHLEDAIRAYKAAMAATPDYPGYWTLELADICRRTGRMKEAARLLNDLVTRTGWDNMKRQGFTQLADVYRDTGRIREMVDVLIRTEEEVPDRLVYSDDLIYDPKMNLAKKALLANTLALRLRGKPTLLQCRLLLADLLLDLGESVQAHMLIDEVMAAAQNDAPMLRKILTLCNRHDPGLASLGKRVKTRLAAIPQPDNM